MPKTVAEGIQNALQSVIAARQMKNQENQFNRGYQLQDRQLALLEGAKAKWVPETKEEAFGYAAAGKAPGVIMGDFYGGSAPNQSLSNQTTPSPKMQAHGGGVRAEAIAAIQAGADPKLVLARLAEIEGGA